MNTLSRFKAITFFLIAMFLLSACGEMLQRWVVSKDNSNHGSVDVPNHDDQGGSGGNHGSGGD